MDVLILFAAGLALAHFVYEGIVAPSLRIKARNRLFALRDELRALQVRQADSRHAEAFEIVHGGINSYLNLLSGVNLHFVRRFYRASKKQEFRAELARREKLIDDFDCRELQSIIKRSGDVIGDVFFINSGAWFVYVIPLLAVALCVSQVAGMVRKVLTAPADRTARMMDEFVTA